MRASAAWVLLGFLALSGCSERELARAASDWCRYNADCDHHGEVEGDSAARSL